MTEAVEEPARRAFRFEGDRTADLDVTLRIPAEPVIDPELSIVIPALNEALTIGEFIDWCHEGMKRAGVVGEIIIVDSSTDKTAEIALSRGAYVVVAPKRGLGRAYIDALPFVRGRYILMGDCDCTYDFRELKPFVDKFREGYEYIMGSRYAGYIEPGAMPALHRYFGTPLTTWILNVMYRSRFSDIHCGMRGISTDAFRRLGLQSQSWEYASELVLKSVHMKLRTCEVPIRFLKDRDGRMSHHRRSGWFSPWHAGWINLRAMFIFGADFFLFRPGIVVGLLGLILTAAVAFGPINVGPITLSLHWMFLGVCLAVVGIESAYLGVIAQVLYDQVGDSRRRWARVFAYTRTTLISAAIFIGGAALAMPLLYQYIANGFRLSELDTSTFAGVAGLLLLIIGFSTFGFMLVLHAALLSTSASGADAQSSDS